VPLWVKISPGLADTQYAILMRVFAETGVQAVIATNTWGQPSPTNPDEIAGVGGGSLHDCAVAATIGLSHEKHRHGYDVDVIGCGGVMDNSTFRAFGTQAAQYWSGLIYRGPLVGAFIINEELHG
jgi:dihydroorotate dehydrogenase